MSAIVLGWVLLWVLGWSIDWAVDDGDLPAHAMARGCERWDGVLLPGGVGLAAVAAVPTTFAAEAHPLP